MSLNQNKIITGLLLILLTIPMISPITSSQTENEIQTLDNELQISGIYTGGAYMLPDTEIPDEKPTNLAPAPSYWNWKDATYNGKTGNWLTSVKKQGECGSCWAFAAIAALEAMVNIQRNDPTIDLDLSEQQLVSCCHKGCNGCHGGNSYYSWEYLMDNGGSILESCFPYKGIDANGCDSWKTSNCNKDPVECDYQCDESGGFTVPILRMGFYDDPGFKLIKNTLYNHGPVVTYMLIYEDFNYYKSGIYTHDPNSDILGGHAVIIVGYNEDQEYLICKNSWGQNWGEDGFFRIPLGECYLGNEIYYVEVNDNELNFQPQADAGGYYNAYPNEIIDFSSQASYDMDDNIVSWFWDFGDGSTSTEENPTHIYSEKGIYEVSLTVVDEFGLQDIDTTTAYIDLWDVDDFWIYDISMQTVPDALYPPIRMPLSLDINDLELSVVGESDEAYNLDVTGNIKGDMALSFDRENSLLDFKIWGKINAGRLKGTLQIQKEGLAVKKYTLDITGFSQFLALPIIPIPIYVPVPFSIHLEQENDESIPLIGAAPNIGSEWVTDETTSSLEIIISSMLGLISKSVENPNVINEPTSYICTAIDTIETPQGAYASYVFTSESSTQTKELFYAEDVYNIVKFIMEDPELYLLSGTLLSSNYQ